MKGIFRIQLMLSAFFSPYNVILKFRQRNKKNPLLLFSQGSVYTERNQITTVSLWYIFLQWRHRNDVNPKRREINWHGSGIRIKVRNLTETWNWRYIVKVIYFLYGKWKVLCRRSKNKAKCKCCKEEGWNVIH